MKNDIIEMLAIYIQSNVAPILAPIKSEIVPDSIIIKANCDSSLLTEKIEDGVYKAPKWYYDIQKKESNIKTLVIDKIDSIPKKEQNKFYELLKDRKVGTFTLPDNCSIVLTATNITEDSINDFLLSMCAIIR